MQLVQAAWKVEMQLGCNRYEAGRESGLMHCLGMRGASREITRKASVAVAYLETIIGQFYTLQD